MTVNEVKYEMRVIDTESLEDITNSVDHLNFQEGISGSMYSFIINGKPISLIPTRCPVRNKVYAVKISDSLGNYVHRMLEVK